MLDLCFRALPRNRSVIHWVDPQMSNDQLEDGAENVDESLVERRSVPKRKILMEVVSAILPSHERETVDPYVKVQVWDERLRKPKVLHKTDTIKNDDTPIWTVKTKSLCLLDIPLSGNATTPAPTSPDLEHEDVPDVRSSILVDICHGGARLARVPISFDEILQHCQSDKEGERLEYQLEPGAVENGLIALRFRQATEQDVVFIEKLDRMSIFSKSSVREASGTSTVARTGSSDDQELAALYPADERLVASDINFASVKGKSLFRRNQKKDNTGQKMSRVLPYPNPDQPDATEWMTEAQLNHAAYQPSSKWVTAGCGRAGTLHLEILYCDKLPQLDTDIVGDVTDPFCVTCFEDNMLRTDVIWDSLSPRWPPWSTRAFQFAIRHPASLLCLAVFDYDITPVDNHDPIGRIVLRPQNFKSSLTYTLHYPLKDDPEEHTDSATMMEAANDESNTVSAPRGTVTIRLRVEWEDDVMKLFQKPPPRFIINVDNEHSYRVLCYLTRGAVFMDEANLKTCKLLAREVVGYWSSYCFVADVVLEILLWRGRWQLSDHRSLWFPIHSVMLFSSVVIVVEKPHYTLPILLYALAWILLTLNYHASHHPYPWKRVPSCLETNLLTILGRRSLFSSSFHSDGGHEAEIPPNLGAVEGAQLEKLDVLKAARMSALIQYSLKFMLKVYRTYSKTSDYAVKITTETHSWDALSFLSARLYYVHLLLKMIVKYLRLGRNFLSWKSSYTAVITTRCILFACAWLILPMNTILQWTARIVVWSLLGPWMKFVDLFYFRPWYETKEELLERVLNGTDTEDAGMPNLESILENETFRKMTKAGRVKAEDLYKLRDMRMLLFGAYSESVPVTDNSRFPAVPLPKSTAVKSEWVVDHQSGGGRGYHVPGQLLSGHMVLSRSIEAPGEIGSSQLHPSSDSEEDKKQK